MLASVKQQYWPKNNTRNYRKFVSNRSRYSMKLSMILWWKRHLRPVTPLMKGQGAMPPISCVPACRYQQSLSPCIICQDVCVQTAHHMRQNAYYRNLKWSLEDLLPCYCYTIKTNSRTIRSQVSQPASADKWATSKLTTAWHQNSEPGSCAVWVSYWQINCHCNN